MSQGSTYPYCNTTSDLQRAYSSIESYAGRETYNNFTQTSGETNTYELPGTGYVGVVYENDTELTIQTSIADTESSAGSYYYDETNDILYVHTSDSSAPTSNEIEGAFADWNDFKVSCRNDAMEMVESFLDPDYPRPVPFARNSYQGNKYDTDIVLSTALLTCYNIVSARNPADPVAEVLYRSVWHPTEDSGILYEYKTGMRAFSFETTKSDFTGNAEAITYDSTSTGKIFLTGQYTAQDHREFHLKITTAGAVETAEFQYSNDGGNTWSDAITTEYNYQYIGYGIYVRFEGIFVLNDEWQIDVAANWEATKGIKSIWMSRN